MKQQIGQSVGVREGGKQAMVTGTFQSGTVLASLPRCPVFVSMLVGEGKGRIEEGENSYISGNDERDGKDVMKGRDCRRWD